MAGKTWYVGLDRVPVVWATAVVGEVAQTTIVQLTLDPGDRWADGVLWARTGDPVPPAALAAAQAEASTDPVPAARPRPAEVGTDGGGGGGTGGGGISPYDPAKAYVVDAQVTHAGHIWRALAPASGVEPVEGATWTRLLAGVTPTDATDAELAAGLAGKADVSALSAKQDAATAATDAELAAGLSGKADVARVATLEAAATPTVTYNGVVLADTPLAYYRLGETSGTSMVDSSGNARHGTYAGSAGVGATGLLSGDTDRALGLTANVDGYGTVASAAWMNVSTLTVECLVRFSSAVDGQNGDAILTRYTSAGGFTWMLWRNTTGQLAAQVRNGAGTVYNLTSGVAAANGETYHVALTVSASALTLYVNGGQVATAAFTGGLQASTSPIEVGRYSQSASTVPGGTVDEAAVYGVALTQARVAAHASAVRAGTTADPTLELPLTDLSGWVSEAGTWAAQTDRITNTSTATAASRLRLASFALSAVAVVECDVRIDSSEQANSRVGLSLGVPDAGGTNGGVIALLRTATSTLGAVNTESDAVTAGASFTLPSTIAYGTWATLRLELAGESITVYVNGTLLGTARNAVAGGVAPRSRLALWSYQAVCSFRNLKVWRVDPFRVGPRGLKGDTGAPGTTIVGGGIGIGSQQPSDPVATPIWIKASGV